jgi:hypothetical protein
MPSWAELDPITRDRLTAAAARDGVALSEYVTNVLTRHAAALATGSAPVSDDRFEAAMRQTLTEHADVYRRLAQ